MDKLQFEQWPHVTRFKNWMTSLQREVITDSTPPRPATDWLAEIDQATSRQVLDDVGSVLGSTRMSIVKTLGSPAAKGLMKIMNPEFKSQNQVVDELQEKKKLPTLTGRQLAFMIFVFFFEINDVQGGATNMNDLLHVGLANDTTSRSSIRPGKQP